MKEYIKDCKHNKSTFCALCEMGYTILKKCRDCGIKIWTRHNEKIQHHAGNPKRTEFVKTIREFRKIFPRSFFTYSEYQIFKEIHVSGLKDYFSIRIGNFESKNLHTLNS